MQLRSSLANQKVELCDSFNVFSYLILTYLILRGEVREWLSLGIPRGLLNTENRSELFLHASV